MNQQRNRKPQTLSFQERLNQFSRDARAAARKLPPGAERADLLQKARASEAAARMDRWLSSSDLQNPKWRDSRL